MSKFGSHEEKSVARLGHEAKKRRQRFVDRVELEAYRRVFKDKGILMTAVIDEIAAERQRQRDSEGWDDAHDDAHTDGSLATAAACYAMSGAGCQPAFIARVKSSIWKWAPTWWKPKNKRRDLVRAAALIVAEIERLDRAEATAVTDKIQ